MSTKQLHKEWRENFRNSALKRDNNKCRICKNANDPEVHHITDRKEIPNGGYVISNGITLCAHCHLNAEKYHISNGLNWVEGFHPNELYTIIGSSYEIALRDSKELCSTPPAH